MQNGEVLFFGSKKMFNRKTNNLKRKRKQPKINTSSGEKEREINFDLKKRKNNNSPFYR